MSDQEWEQALQMAQTERDLALKMELTKKESHLKTLQEELRKLVESPETIERINRHVPLLVEDIKATYKHRDNEIKRSGARLRMIICPLISLSFSSVAWYNFARSNTLLGWEFVGFALAFVAMLVLGLIFDRPR
jgi:hypothetical protein